GEEVGGGGAVLEAVWCQRTIFPFTTRKIAVARSPGPSQRLCGRSPSSNVARAVCPWLLIETIRPEHGSAEFQASAWAWVRRRMTLEPWTTSAPGAKRSAAPLLSSAFPAWPHARTTLWVDGGLLPQPDASTANSAPSSRPG